MWEFFNSLAQDGALEGATIEFTIGWHEKHKKNPDGSTKGFPTAVDMILAPAEPHAPGFSLAPEAFPTAKGQRGKASSSSGASGDSGAPMMALQWGVDVVGENTGMAKGGNWGGGYQDGRRLWDDGREDDARLKIYE